MENSIIMIVAVASFVISSVIGKFLIPVLHKIKFGQPIRDEGPQWHQKKSGTPTMGGIMFIVGAVCVSIIGYVVLCILNPGSRDFIDHLKFYSGIVMALLFGVIGFVDDYIKVVEVGFMYLFLIFYSSVRSGCSEFPNNHIFIQLSLFEDMLNVLTNSGF